MQVKLTVPEMLTWVVNQLREAGQDMIPNAEQLDILTKRMRARTQEAQNDYHDALTAVCEIRNPKHPDVGKLPKKRAALAEKDAQGREWTAELEATQAPSDDRRSDLEKWLEALEADCDKLESDIKQLEELLRLREETAALRKASYEKAKRDLKKLEQVAPSILAQTEALDDAKKERLAAIAADKDSDDSAGALVAQLEADLAEARSSDDAAEILVVEEDDDEVDLDAVIAAEKAKKAGSRRTRWSSAGTTQQEKTE